MNRIDERLDQQIDALIAREMPDDSLLDDELRGLLATVREVRQLREPEWPDDDFPATLATRVISRVQAGERAPRPFRDDDGETPFTPNGLHEPSVSPILTVDRVIEQPVKRPWLRHGLEILAAGLVLAIVAALMIALLGILQGDDEEPTLGGPAATTQPGWTTMRSTEHSFAIDYPADWNADPDALFAVAPDQTVSLTISLFQPNEPLETNEQLTSWVTQDATRGEITVLTSRDLGGVPNTVFVNDTTELTYAKVNPIVSLGLYAKPNEWVYEVHCSSPSRDEFARWRSTCEQIIESFRFIDGEDSEPAEPADASGIWNADPIAKRLHDEGLGRALGLAQTVEGYTMTLRWAGSDYNRIGLHLTLRAPDGQPVDGMNPLKPRLTTADDTNLRSIGDSSSEIHDGIGEYLEWFDARAISTAGELAVELDVPAIQILIPVDPDGPPPPDVTVVAPDSTRPGQAETGTHDAQGLPLSVYRTGDTHASVTVHTDFSFNFSLPFEPVSTGQSAPESEAPTPPATHSEPLTLDQAKEQVRDFLGEPEAVLDGYLSDPRQAVPGRGIEPGPGLASAPTTLVITRQMADLPYADEFTVDPETGEVIGANLPSNTTLGQPAQPISEAMAQTIVEEFARRHFFGFADLTFREVNTRSSAPGVDDGDPLLTALWQTQADDSIAWLPTWVRVSVDLETGLVFNYSAIRGEYDGPTTPGITEAAAIEIALAEAQKDPELTGATIGSIALETAAPDGEQRLVWFILLANVPDGANTRHFHIDALTGNVLNPIGSPNS